MLDPDQQQNLYGQESASRPLNDLSLHTEALQAFTHLQQKALTAGFELKLASSYRSFDRQLSIWNRKASGDLPVYDDAGRKLDISQMSEEQLMFKILRWSALPGASRHHWATDCDVFDAAAVTDDYSLQLSISEYSDKGPFANLSQWLDQQTNNNAAFGFFRPYQNDRGGIAPEPWHLSYAPLARQFQQQFSLEQLRQILCQTDIQLQQTILDNLDLIFRRYIHVPFSSYPEEELEY